MGIMVSKCLCCGSSLLTSNPALWMPFVSDRALGLPPLSITESMGFRSIKEGTGYAMCKSLHCQQCGHLFVDYRFSDEEMTSLYKDYRGSEYISIRSMYEADYKAKNDELILGSGYLRLVELFLVDLLPSRDLSILDWGGDVGKNTPFARQASILHIYDPSNKEPELKNAINVFKTKGFLDNYDLFVLANVLEHMPFPQSALNDLTSHMSEHAILYIEVPYERIQAEAIQEPPYTLRSKKVHWHEHINFFSIDSLFALLRRSRLNVIKFGVAEVDTAAAGVSFSRIMQVVCKLAENDEQLVM